MANGSYTQRRENEEGEGGEAQGGFFRRPGSEENVEWKDTRVGRALSRRDDDRTTGVSPGTVAKGAAIAVGAINPIIGSGLALLNALKPDGTTTGDPDTNRVSPDDGGASRITEDHTQQIEEEILLKTLLLLTLLLLKELIYQKE